MFEDPKPQTDAEILGGIVAVILAIILLTIASCAHAATPEECAEASVIVGQLRRQAVKAEAEAERAKTPMYGAYGQPIALPGKWGYVASAIQQGLADDANRKADNLERALARECHRF